MHVPASRKKSAFKTVAIALGVIAAFACGWLVSEVQHVNSVSPRMVWVDQWVDDLALLTSPRADVRLKTPEQTQALALSSLNTDSHTVALLYDTLPPDLKQRVDFWMPAARSIAGAQQDAGAVNDRSNLRALVDCAQTRPSHGGSVRACFDARQKTPESH